MRASTQPSDSASVMTMWTGSSTARVFVRVGTELSRQDALELALVSSDNRAASALARAYPGGESAFVQALQAKVRALGLRNTSLQEPTGLSPQNTSTAIEVARITAAAALPRDRPSPAANAPPWPLSGRTRELHNTNRLVGAKGWNILLSKTGYTDEAGRCLAMRMMSGARAVTVVLLDADGSAHRLRDAALIRKSLSRTAS